MLDQAKVRLRFEVGQHADKVSVQPTKFCHVIMFDMISVRQLPKSVYVTVNRIWPCYVTNVI
jgi:hypothetical protein